jgi:hypothetical protein
MKAPMPKKTAMQTLRDGSTFQRMCRIHAFAHKIATSSLSLLKLLFFCRDPVKVPHFSNIAMAKTTGWRFPRHPPGGSWDITSSQELDFEEWWRLTDTSKIQ